MLEQKNVQVKVGSSFQKICPFPVGSIYISVINTSPATIFGGTWTAINGDACLMACTSSIGSYSGTKKISINQMPSHKHAIGIGDDSDGNVQNTWVLLGKSPNYSFPGYPDALHKIVQQRGRGFQVSESMVNTGGGQDYLPYHFRTYMWKRTA